jgi:hypothetical protein
VQQQFAKKKRDKKHDTIAQRQQKAVRHLPEKKASSRNVVHI